ncbi:MAG: hypothetical protein LUG12_10160 [Erysipelotrichaceae bacterium]|nr:hypothetical protein [Erysipelotrichaceae bacterium]
MNNKLIKMLFIITLAITLVGCNDTTNDTDIKAISAVEPKSEEITEEATTLWNNTYSDLINAGYFKERSDYDYYEVFYDNTHDSFYGIYVSKGYILRLTGINEDEKYYVDIIDVDENGNSIEYADTVSRETTYGDITDTEEMKHYIDGGLEYFLNIITINNIVNGDSSYTLKMCSSTTLDDYTVIFIKYIYNYAYINNSHIISGYRIFLKDDHVEQIQTINYQSDDYNDYYLGDTFNVYDIGAKSSSDFDFDAYKETYSSFEGISNSEFNEKFKALE